MDLTWAGEKFTLLADRGCYRCDAQTLIVSDLHLGKAATFRGAGVPVPEASTDSTLARLDRMIAASGARRMLVLGDFYHARSGRTETLDAAVQAWRDRHVSLSISMVIGNHDEHAGDPPRELGIENLGARWDDGAIEFVHEPPTRAARPTMCGHVHPAIALSDRAGFTHRRACFWFGATVALLPATGAFTGTKSITPRHGDRVYLIADGEVVAVPA